jgi:protein-L-isoaspartate O-methyltransferase
MTNFSEIAAKYEKNSLVQKSASDKLFDLLQIKENDAVLDVGCGTGNLTKIIAEKTRGRVIGIDASEQMIEEAKRNYSHLDILLQSIAASWKDGRTSPGPEYLLTQLHRSTSQGKARSEASGAIDIFSITLALSGNPGRI